MRLLKAKLTEREHKEHDLSVCESVAAMWFWVRTHRPFIVDWPDMKGAFFSGFLICGFHLFPHPVSCHITLVFDFIRVIVSFFCYLYYEMCAPILVQSSGMHATILASTAPAVKRHTPNWACPFPKRSRGARSAHKPLSNEGVGDLCHRPVLALPPCSTT